MPFWKEAVMPKDVAKKPVTETTLAWKDMFMGIWEQEYQTTMKLLKAYPEGKSDLRPHAKLRTARELAWGFLGGEAWMIEGCVTGSFDMGNAAEPTGPPATMHEVIDAYEKQHSDSMAKVKRMNDADFNKTIKFFVAPKQMGDYRCADLLSMMVRDHIHHRGQLSVYLRMADGKVPSIYGPTADEPWM
jgi:uncharacterized damage-inducible protein DinB